MTWKDLLPAIVPELILIGAACVLFLIGISTSRAARKMSAALALLAMVAVVLVQLTTTTIGTLADPSGSVRVTEFGQYIKLLAAALGAMFVLLSWPSDPDAGGNPSIRFGADAASEFFALLLLSVSGICVVASANDLILLFLGVELASIPTYIMVSISRPLPRAQEAGVKYFFLGAMAAAVMLFGFSYLYGATGSTDLSLLTSKFASMSSSAQAPQLGSWITLAAVMLIGGFGFKIAAVPLHFYAGDVYEGAATPVTALLSFVPKTSGFVALMKILFCLSGGAWLAAAPIGKLLWVLAVLTMTIGNLVGLRQENVKRLLAYSSIAHTGYMLVGLTAASTAGNAILAAQAIEGVLFYLAAYGIMNVAAFGVLELLPARGRRPGTSAESFDDLAGAGRRHVALGLAMAVACFSLIGLPLTVGFFGKIYLLRPALSGHNYWLVVIMMINAAISAAYYLRIVGVMFLRADAPIFGSSDAVATPAHPVAAPMAAPIAVAVILSTLATLTLGTIFPATELLHGKTVESATIDSPSISVTLSNPAER